MLVTYSQETLQETCARFVYKFLDCVSPALVTVLAVEHRPPQITCIRPALSCAAGSVFLHLYS